MIKIQKLVACTMLFLVSLILFSAYYASAEEGKLLRLAVIGFRKTGENIEPHELDKIITEWLTEFLVNTKAFEVVERQELEKVLQEQSLGQTGILDSKSAAQVGNILGVDVLITGTLIYFDDTFEVVARQIDATTGSILGVASVSTDDGDELRSHVEELAQMIYRKLSPKRPVADAKLYETFDGEKLDTDRWFVEFSENFGKNDRKRTSLIQQAGVLRITGEYPKKKDDRLLWLVPNISGSYHSFEAKIRIREVEDGVSVCIGANWDEQEYWTGICPYFDEGEGDISVILEDSEEHEAIFDFDVNINKWHFLRLEYDENHFNYYWDDKLIKRNIPIPPISDFTYLEFEMEVVTDTTKSAVIEIDEIILR